MQIFCFCRYHMQTSRQLSLHMAHVQQARPSQSWQECMNEYCSAGVQHNPRTPTPTCMHMHPQPHPPTHPHTHTHIVCIDASHKTVSVRIWNHPTHNFKDETYPIKVPQASKRCTASSKDSNTRRRMQAPCLVPQRHPLCWQRSKAESECVCALMWQQDTN